MLGFLLWLGCAFIGGAQTKQFDDGRIIFPATDGKLSGAATLQSANVLFNGDGSVTWNYKPTRWGMYDIELTLAGERYDKVELEVELPNKTLKVSNFAPVAKVGRFYVSKAEPFSVTIHSRGLGDARLSAVTLTPAP